MAAAAAAKGVRGCRFGWWPRLLFWRKVNEGAWFQWILKGPKLRGNAKI